MIRPVVVGEPVASAVMSIGQAPGIKEGPAGRPFAWTAGKTLFSWFDSIGVDEASYRRHVYMAAVCRCYPGKSQKGSGDRVPSLDEIAACRSWLDMELDLLKPKLIIPIGKLAIAQLMPVDKLKDVIGKCFQISIKGQDTDVVPLPHPSGLNTWFRTEPGKTLLADALAIIQEHPAWQKMLSGKD